MSGRRYRVVKTLPWIEGGKPAPPGSGTLWEGGEGVIYQPGDTVHMEDQDLESMSLYVDALDDAGRAVLEEARAKATAPAKITPVADFTPNDVEFLTRALDEKRRVHGSVPEYAVRRDGTEVLLRYVPTNPRPGVIYGDNGLPDPWATALQRERREMESKLARIHSGGSRGGRRGRQTKRDKAARADEALLSAVRAYRAKHPDRGRPAIAAALVDKHGRLIDHADPTDRKRAIAALVKRIERLERKSLDT
jgi:hypothetical protein